ncbi:MAG TPA: signal peptidase I [Allosphingosinicella sp.]|nr:signal peptidase I [Allosphingosinicella sp.]
MESDTPPETAAAEPRTAGRDGTAPAAAPAKKKESWWETLRFFLILFVAAVLIRSLFLAPFSIPSGSMLPNLMIGDYLFVAKWPYGYSRHSFPFGIASFDGRILGGLPERGDIVVFRYPGPENEDYIKRVIGLPGDQIEVREGALILNGEPVPRQRIADYAMPVSANSPCRAAGAAREIAGRDGGRACAYPRFRETLPGGRSFEVLDQVGDSPGDSMEPVIVPEGQLFVMGDNRDDSLDSRFEVDEGGVGLLPVDNVLGRAAIGFWSTDGSAEWLKPWTWFSAARWGRIGQTW